jgi:uncharacterized protein (DUF2132 family)
MLSIINKDLRCGQFNCFLRVPAIESIMEMSRKTLWKNRKEFFAEDESRLAKSQGFGACCHVARGAGSRNRKIDFPRHGHGKIENKSFREESNGSGIRRAKVEGRTAAESHK